MISHSSSSLDEITSIRTDVSSSLKPQQNPFRLPPTAELFGFIEYEKQQKRAEQRALSQLSISKRASMLKSTLPPCVTRTTAIRRSAPIVSPVPTVRKAERMQRISEFLQQKREIYIVQLLIDTKEKEIKSINDTIKNEEAGFVQTEQNLIQMSNEYKKATSEIERELAQARQSLENTIRKRVEATQKHKQAMNQVGLIRCDISRNEETLETYQAYNGFLSIFSEKPATLEDPKYLIQQLDDIEKENLFLIETCSHFERKMDNSIIPMKQQLKELDELNQDAEQMKVSEIFDDISASAEVTNAHNFETVDKELTDLQRLVINAFRKCIKSDADIPVLSMLEQIENKFEEAFQITETIDKHWLSEKQAKIDKQRREEDRMEKQKQQALEQQRKTIMAIERANKPIQKHEGRPLYPKTKPIQKEKKVDFKKIRLMNELKRQEELLFGDSIE